MAADEQQTPRGYVVRRRSSGELVQDGDYIRDNVGLDWRFRGTTRSGQLLVQARGVPGTLAPSLFPNVSVEEA